MATVTTQERTNILKLVAGMFNAAPGAAYLNEFTNAFVDLNKDLGALANALGQTGAFQSLYPSFLTADEFANKFLDTLGLKANTEAQDWVKAKVNAGESFASVAFQALVAIDASTADDFKAARDQLTNKATAAEYYSVTLQASSDDLAALQNVVAKVTADPKSVEAANQANEVGNGNTYMLTTGLDDRVANEFIASQTRHNVDGKGPTLNPGDKLTGVADRTDNKLLIVDLTPDAAQNNLPAGVTLSNIQIVELDSAANTALGGLRTRDFASVNELKASTQGAGNVDLYIAGNENFGTATKVDVVQLSFAAGSGVVVDGGHDVTVNANGGAGVRVGNQNLASVPTAQQVATGTVDVTVNNTAAGGINVFGGTTVKATVNSTSNTGAINIGNTAANTGNNKAGAIANASGDITVNTAGTGAVTVFGGDNVTVASTALSGAGAITVGDIGYVDPSNLPKGNVTITETAQIAYNGLVGSANNNALSGAIGVHGGKDVSITTNAANLINVGQVGNLAKENALNPTGAITVTNTGIETVAAAGAINITGGTDVSVTTTGSNVTIGRAANAVTDQASNPTGDVTVTQTMNGAGFGRTVTIDGGKDVTVNAKGQAVNIGSAVASAPTGAVVVNQADIFTGNANAVLNGTNAGNVTVRGGTDVTINTTGGNVAVGGVVGGVNTVPSGAVKVTNTFGGVGADTVTVQGGTTVDITTTKTSGAITVGGASAALNAAGTALKDANLAPTGDVTIVNKTVSGANTAYGTGVVNVNTNGAATVSVTGGNLDSITDIQSTLATGGANAGKAIGTSTLKNVVIDNQQAGGVVAIRSDALTNLTVTNQKGAADTITITNNTAAHALTITQGGNSTAGSTVQIVDATAGSLTIKDNGTASTNVLRVDATKATAVTIDNAAAAAIDLGAVSSDIATVTLKGAGNVNLSASGSFGTGNLSKAKTVDASAATGNVTAALQMTTTTDEVQSYKGGAGVDTITVNSNASGWSSKATIDGGNGSADVLVANYAAAGTDVALGNAANVKGFEVLRLGAAANSAGGAYDASGFSTVQVGAVAGNVTFSNTAAGLTLDVLDNTTANKTVTVNGANYSATNSAMTINLGTANTAAAGAASNAKVINGGGATTGAITANGIEALTVNAVANLVTAGAATQGNAATINGVASNGAATLTVGGAGNLTLTSNTGFTSINASGNTGTTVDVTAAAVSNSGVTFTGGASKLVAAGSNDSGNVKALVTIGATGNALTVGQTITVNVNGTTFVYTAPAAGATAAQVATDIAAAINAQGVGLPATVAQTGGNVLGAAAATASGGNIVLQHTAAFEVQATKGVGVAATTTIADSLLGGQQVNVVTAGTVEIGDTFTVTINGTAYGFTATAATAANVATGLAAAITGANVAGISSAVASGNELIITSQLGQTNLVIASTTDGGGANTQTLVDVTNINMTTVNNEFITGSGGGEYKAGLGGSFSTVTKKFGSGSETVNLSASTAKVDTLVLKEGAIVTDNGTKGGVTAFTVGSQSASDTVVFRNAADNATQAKTIVANAVTGVVNTLNNAANMAAVFDSTGALNTKLANLTYTISNGVITFGATGGNSLSQFTVNELINAAQIIVNSSTTGGANKVAAFSHNGKSYVVASDNVATLQGSAGAGSNTNNVVVELKDVASVKGFGSTFGDGTIVSSTVTNLTNAAVDLAALATNSNLDYTGFAMATLAVNGTAAANTNTTKFANLAASAELVVNATAVGAHLGLLETTQVGASGKNSLTVTQATNATTINRLTVNGDALVQFKNGGQALTVSELVDATNTVNTVQVGAGAGTTTIGKIAGTALTNINTVNATGTVALGVSASDAIAQNNVKFDLAVNQAATIFASGTGDTFVQGSATTSGNGAVTLTATGANNTITLSNGANTITANGAGNTISVGTGSNTITATGADVTFNVASNANVTTITVGTNATVNLGTAGGAAANEVIIVDRAVTGGTADNFAKTTISFATGVAATGTVIDFDATVNTAAFSLLGTNMANSQVNVASATSLTEALNLAANYTLLVQDQGTAATAAANLLAANTGEITWFQYGGDTYVVAMVNDTTAAVQQTALDANDIVVKLVGLHDLTGAAFNAAAGVETLTLA